MAATVTARFAGRCEACRGPIEVGEQIVPCAGVYGAWDHAACGVAGASKWTPAWVVSFVDGHVERVEVRSYIDAVSVAAKRYTASRTASVRRA